MPTCTRRAYPLRVSEARNGGTLIRKTSLQDRTDDFLRSSNKPTKHRARSLRITRNAGSAHRSRLAAMNNARDDLLFTMSDITRLSQTHETRAHESILRRTRIDVF